MSRQSKLAIPLVLPNDCTWDAKTGQYDRKTGVARETLIAVPEALDELRKIKGPVCVVSIAGPCRQGKSYILSKAFDQGEVFPLGHLVDPETMGIWLWIVPKKFRDSTGRDFTVVLLDSEGIDSVYAKREDDHRIFTLCVLLSSILIYNSVSVPKREDIEYLDIKVKLSRRIQLRSTQKHPKDKDESHFHEAFPYFIWLLRDVVLSLPAGYSSIKDYFIDIVFNTKSQESSSGDKKAAEEILNFFSGFDAFCLPPPAYDREVVQDLNNKELQANPQFFKQIGFFKEMLHSKLTPKRSINEGGVVTGEVLAAMVQQLVETLNTPGALPNIQRAWDLFALNKCTEVMNDAFKRYEKEMMSQVRGKIPCEADLIRAGHLKAMDVGSERFRQETINWSFKNIEKYLNELKEKADAFLFTWIEHNARETENYCNQLFKELKQSILDPVVNRLRGPEGAKMQFSDIVSAYNQIQEKFTTKARGAKDVQTTMFMKFHRELQSEMGTNIGILQKIKEYDDLLAKEKAEKAAIEEQRVLMQKLLEIKDASLLKQQNEALSGLVQTLQEIKDDVSLLKTKITQ